MGVSQETTTLPSGGGASAVARDCPGAAGKMPKAYGDAFRYIAYRDLNERMKMYLEIAERRIQPETCDPRFVATRAV